MLNAHTSQGLDQASLVLAQASQGLDQASQGLAQASLGMAQACLAQYLHLRAWIRPSWARFKPLGDGLTDRQMRQEIPLFSDAQMGSQEAHMRLPKCVENGALKKIK